MGPDTTGAGLEKKPRKKGTFKSGAEWTGNAKGRPPGTRNKVCNAVLDAITADFLKFGPEVIVKVRQDKPDVYLKYVFSLIPQHFGIDTEQGGEGLRQLSEMLAASQQLTRAEA